MSDNYLGEIVKNFSFLLDMGYYLKTTYERCEVIFFSKKYKREIIFIIDHDVNFGVYIEKDNFLLSFFSPRNGYNPKLTFSIGHEFKDELPDIKEDNLTSSLADRYKVAEAAMPLYAEFMRRRLMPVVKGVKWYDQI